MSEQKIAIPGPNAAVPGIALRIETPGIDVATESTPAVAFTSRAVDVLKWIFSFPVVLGVGLVALVFDQVRAFQVDPDMWWHIKTGETILATHRWPTTDPYSFTVLGKHWIAFEWLGDTLIATVSRLGGFRGLELFLIVFGSAVVLALYLLATISSGNSKAGFVATAILTPLVCVSFNLRSQMLGYLFLVITVMALELFRQGKRWALWILPPLFLIWVNTHGTWIVGLGTVFVFWVCGLKKFQLGEIQADQWSPEQHRRISLIFLLSLVAITITPYGTELAVFPLSVASSLPISFANVSEWLPLFASAGLGKYFLTVIFGFFILQITMRLEWRLQELALFLAAASLTFLHTRFLLTFAPFSAPVLARVLARRMPPYLPSKDRYALNGLLMAGVLAVLIHHFPTHVELEQKVADRFPVQAVEYLRQHPVPGPMFNTYNFGGYLIWSRGPEQKVFIDGRGELYEHEGLLAEYVKSYQLQPGGFDVLEHYQIQSCLLRNDEPLTTVLSALPDWRLVYSDRTSALFVRRNPVPASTPESAQYSPERRE